MTQDEIIEMAKQVGVDMSLGEHWSFFIEELEVFAKLVAAKEREEFAVHAVDIARRAVAEEREACAAICDDKHHTWRWDNEPDSSSGPRDCAASIRARGEA